MAKLTFEQAKSELASLEASIAIFKQAGAPVLPMIQARYEQLMKIVNGNASAQVADSFNESIASVINAEGNEQLLADLSKIIGTKCKLTVLVEDGKIKFEAAGSSSTGGGSGATGITRTPTAFNSWDVTFNGETKTFDSAAGAVKHILNDGNNPMNLPKEYGSGNSMVRVLTTYLPKNEIFKAQYVVVGKHVEETKTETAPTV